MVKDEYPVPQFSLAMCTLPQSPQSNQYVADFPLEGLKKFSLTNAVPCQYRFLDIQRYTEDGQLSILASSDLPSEPYAAVSYVWRVLKSIPPEEPAFEVEGIEDYPEIPVELLKTICIAASTFKCALLWLDKLCIRQDSSSSQDGKTDNAWQVEHMYEVYSSCSVCLILPGGLGQLVTLEEKTAWLERSWTLQESLAPPIGRVLFAWSQGDAILQSNFPVLIEEIVPGKVAAASLKPLLQISLKSNVQLLPNPRSNANNPPSTSHNPIQHLSILGTRDPFHTSLIMSLLGALEHTNTTGRLNAIWRCTILRSAKLPQDMLYSIMGLMNIALRVDYSQNVNDIVVEFTAQLLAKGWRADWLGIAPELGPYRGWSAMPLLPRASQEGGKAVVEVGAGGKAVEVKRLLSRDSSAAWWWWLKNAPTGIIDRDGFLTFTARAVPITPDNNQNTAHAGSNTQHPNRPDFITCASDDTTFRILPSSDPQTQTHYAAIIGHRAQYLSGIFSTFVFPHSTLLMLLERRQEDTFRNIGYAWANENIEHNRSSKEFRVGG